MTENVSLGSNLPVAESTLVKISSASYIDKEGRLLLDIDGFKPLDLPDVENKNNFLSYDAEGGIIGQELRMQVYYNEDTNQVVISYAGTDSATDLFGTDPLFIEGGIDNQFTESILKTNEAVEYLANKYSIKPSDITVTGHSLGGGIGQINASIHGFRGVTHDAPEYSQVVESPEFKKFLEDNGISQNGAEESFVNHVEQGSVVSHINALPGVEAWHYGDVVSHNTTGGDQTTEERLAQIDQIGAVMDLMYPGLGDSAEKVAMFIHIAESVFRNHFLDDNFLPEFTSPEERESVLEQEEKAAVYGEHLEAINTAADHIKDGTAQVNSNGTVSIGAAEYSPSANGWHLGGIPGIPGSGSDVSESMGQTLDALSSHADGATFEGLREAVKTEGKKKIQEIQQEWQDQLETSTLVDENGNTIQVTVGPDFVEITTSEGRVRFYEDGRQVTETVGEKGESERQFRYVDEDYYEAFKADIETAVEQDSVQAVAGEIDQALDLESIEDTPIQATAGRLVSAMNNTTSAAGQIQGEIDDIEAALRQNKALEIAATLELERAQADSIPNVLQGDYWASKLTLDVLAGTKETLQTLQARLEDLRAQRESMDDQFENLRQQYNELNDKDPVVGSDLIDLLNPEANAAREAGLIVSLEQAERDDSETNGGGLSNLRHYKGEDGLDVFVSDGRVTYSSDDITITFMDDGSFVWSDKDGNSGSGQVFEDSAGFELLRESVMEQYFVDDQGQGDDGNSAPIDDGHEYSDDNEADRIADIKDILASLGPEVIPPADTLNAPSDFNVDIDFSRLNYNLAISDPVEIDIDALREQLRRAQLNPSEPSDYLVNTQEFELEVGSDSIPIRLAFAGGAGDYTFEGFYGDGWAVLEGDDLHRADEKFGQLTTGNGGLVVDSAGRVARDIGDLQAGRYVDSAGNAYVNHQRVDEPFDFDALTPKQQQDLLDDAGIERYVSAAERDEILRTKYGDGEGDLTAGEVYSLEVLSEDELADLTAQTTQVAHLQTTFTDFYFFYQDLDNLKLAIESGDATAILLATENALVGFDKHLPNIGDTLSLDGVSQVVSLAANVSSLRDALRDGDLSGAVEYGAQSLLDIDTLGGADNGFLSAHALSGAQSVVAGARLVSAIEGGNIGEIAVNGLLAFEALGGNLSQLVSLDVGPNDLGLGVGAVTSLIDLFGADNVGEGLVALADFSVNLAAFSATELGAEILGNNFASTYGTALGQVGGTALAVKHGIDAIDSLLDGDMDAAAVSGARAYASYIALTNPGTAAAVIAATIAYEIFTALLASDKIGSARAVSDGEGGFDIVTGGNKDAFEDQAESVLSGIAESFTEATENLPAGLVLIPERLPQIRVENGEIQIVYIDGNTGKMYVDKDVDQDAIGERLGEIIASYEHFYGADWFYGPEWEAETTRLKGHTNEARQSLDKDGHTEGGAMPYFLPELPVEQINWDDGTFMVTIADLDGDGAEIVDSNTAHFDIDGDGYREPFETWVGPDDAIVGFNHSGAGAFASYQDFFNGNWGYLDTGLTASQANALQGLNADGTEQDPNNYEYFWNQDEEWSGGPDGYYDYVDTTKAPTDGRGEVDASDPAYREFLLWQDANQDGIRDEGEGQTLTQIGVVAVRLNEATGLWEAHTSDNRVIPFYQKDLRFGSNGIREINMASGTLRLFENGGGEFYATTATDLGKYGYVSGGHNVAGAPTKIMVTADKLTSLPPAPIPTPIQQIRTLPEMAVNPMFAGLAGGLAALGIGVGPANAGGSGAAGGNGGSGNYYSGNGNLPTAWQFRDVIDLFQSPLSDSVVAVDTTVDTTPDTNNRIATNLNENPNSNGQTFGEQELLNLLGLNAQGNASGFRIVAIGDAQGGTVTLNDDGSVTFTPDVSFDPTQPIDEALLAFQFVVANEAGEVHIGSNDSQTGTLDPTINTVLLQDDSFVGSEDSPVLITLEELLANDTLLGDGQFTLVAVDGAENGQVFIQNGNIVFVPNQDFNGSAGFSYTLEDQNGHQTSARANVNVLSINDVPIAEDDNINTIEDIPADITDQLLANDTDADGDTPTIISVGNVQGGTASLNGGRLTFTPELNYNGPASLQYTVSDPSGATAIAFANIRINSVNDLPILQTEELPAIEDQVAVINPSELLLNDSDIENELLTVVAVDNAAHGTVSLDPDGKVRFVPDADYFGNEAAFDYTVEDTSGGTSVARATLDVLGIDDIPNLSGSDHQTLEDRTAVIAPVALFANDVDVDGDPLTLVSVQNPVNGTVSIVAGNAEFVPDLNYFGQGTFEYTASDGTTNVSATATVDIASVNDAPTIVDDPQTINEDNDLVVNFASLIANDTDVEGDALVFNGIGGATNGAVSFNNLTGDITFTPTDNFFGLARFEYMVQDIHGAGGAGEVSVTVNPIDDLPVPDDDSFTIAEDALTIFTGTSMLANDLDVDNDPLSLTRVFNSLNGTVTLVSGNAVFVPDADYFGAASFEYEMTDGNTLATAKVNIDITSVNDAPDTVGETGVLDEDTFIDFAVADLLTNDSDLEGDNPLTVTGVGNSLKGTTELSLDGTTIRFTPAMDYFGAAAQFDYFVADSLGDANPATVNLTVDPTQDPPTAVDDNIRTTQNKVNNISQVEFLANDFDIDGDTVNVQSVGAASVGTVSFVGGVVTYTAPVNYLGAAQFQYTINDGFGNTATATANLSVEANIGPIGVNDAINSDEDVVLIMPKSQLVANDLDADRDELFVTDVDNAFNGTVELLPNGSVKFTPDANYVGAASFDYTVSDNISAGTDTASVSLTINPVNDAPIVAGESASSSEDATAFFSAADLLTNDFDIEGDSLSITGVSTGNGSVSINGDSIAYRASANFNGNTSFRYTVSDGNGGFTNGSVAVDVDPVNDTPTVASESVSGFENIATFVGSGTLLANDYDIDGDSIHISNAHSASNGSVSWDGGTVRYAPNFGFSGTGSFKYDVSDGHGGVTTGTAFVNVAPNQPPWVVGDSDNSNGFDNVTGQLTAFDPDGNSANVTFELISNASASNVTVYSNGAFSVDIQSNFNPILPTVARFDNDFTVRLTDEDNKSSTYTSVAVYLYSLGSPFYNPGAGLHFNTGAEATAWLGPVAVDLDGDGVELVSLEQSDVLFDIDGDGVRDRTAWVDTDDGLLVYDNNGDRIIENVDEISFIDYLPGARTDLEGLAAFDSDGDGVFGVQDQKWQDFAVWQDKNGDGTTDEGELLSLDDLGIEGVELESDGDAYYEEDVVVHGTTKVLYTDGSTGEATDTMFKYESSEKLAQAELKAEEAAEQTAQIILDGEDKNGEVETLEESTESDDLLVELPDEEPGLVEKPEETPEESETAIDGPEGKISAEPDSKEQNDELKVEPKTEEQDSASGLVEPRAESEPEGKISAEPDSKEQNDELKAEPKTEEQDSASGLVEPRAESEPEGTEAQAEDLNAEADRQAEALAAEAAAFDPPVSAQDIGSVIDDAPLIDAAVDNPAEEVPLAA